MKFKIGTRSSSLALVQAKQVKNALLSTKLFKEDGIEIVPMPTKGDQILDRYLVDIGGKGLFTEEIENALLSKKIDLAVHSAKDITPMDSNGLCVRLFLKREDPREVFISRKFPSFKSLPTGASIGTASLRRRSIIKHLRPDLKTVLLRGNVGTRLKKLDLGQFDATFLAYAGLKRLALEHEIQEIMDEHVFPPAPGQGAIAIQIREGDLKTLDCVNLITDPKTCIEVSCERTFTHELDGSCRTPLAALAKIFDDKITLRGTIFSLDGSLVYSHEAEKPVEQSTTLAKEVAQILRVKAGDNFFDMWG